MQSALHRIWAVGLLVSIISALFPVARAGGAEPVKPATTQASVPDWVFAPDDKPAMKSGEVPASPGPLKVGVIISRFTATGPSWAGSPYGYTHASIALLLVNENIQLYAIAEPGSEDDAEFVAALAANFPADVPKISSTDPAALRTLDVIVAQRIANMNDETISAIHQAVQEGTSLFISQTFGTVTPGYTASICDLFGLNNADYGFHATPLPIDVVATDPILQGTENAGTEWQAQPSGTLGVPREGVTPLIKLRSIDDLSVARSRPDGGQLLMLYFWHFGKGAVIVSNFKELPDELKDLSGDNFYLRCVKRAAALRQRP
jgi:hypothetical protein